jgi:hypothetical protein
MDCGVGWLSHGEVDQQQQQRSDQLLDSQSRNGGGIQRKQLATAFHGTADNDIDEAGGYSPTAAQYQSRHSQYQRRQNKNSNDQRDVQCASPTMSNGSAPASIPSLQQQQEQLEKQQTNKTR